MNLFEKPSDLDTLRFENLQTRKLCEQKSNSKSPGLRQLAKFSKFPHLPRRIEFENFDDIIRSGILNSRDNDKIGTKKENPPINIEISIRISL
jgi:hypothetical protein